jgi:hypothetical protein
MSEQWPAVEWRFDRLRVSRRALEMPYRSTYGLYKNRSATKVGSPRQRIVQQLREFGDFPARPIYRRKSKIKIKRGMLVGKGGMRIKPTR